jgi:hypothetical protein
MATILAKRSGAEIPTTTDDDHHEVLANDPAITSIPQGTTYDSFNTNNLSSSGASTFGAPAAGGFGTTSPGFGAVPPASTGFGSSSAFGTSASGFGSTQNINQSTGNQPVLTGAAPSNAASGADVLVANDNTDWINKKWRPVMGWMYMMVCVCDFTIFPILWSVLQALSHGSVTTQWQPLTLQGAGLFHVAMGAVLGIAAYGRTKEKIEGKS